MKTVYAFLADGLEEVECLMVVDLLRRDVYKRQVQYGTCCS